LSQSATPTTMAKVMTTASDLYGEPVRLETSPSCVVTNPSRPSAKRSRAAPTAQPSPLANALISAPKLIASAIPLPT
jgi:hypothetical protein